MFWRVLCSWLRFSSSELGKLNFCQIFMWDWFLLMIFFGCCSFVVKRTCIKGGFHDVHVLFHIVVHSVLTRCLIKFLLGIFSLVWTSMSIKLWGFSCFLIRNMFWFIGCIFNTPYPAFALFMLWSCIALATSCTHLCYPCHALVYTLLSHPSMSYLPYAL